MADYDLAHERATGIYGLEDLTRPWLRRRGYTFVSKKYPEGVPRTMGRFTVGVPPTTASTRRALTGEFGRHAQAAASLISSGVPAITAGNIIRDPKEIDRILGGTYQAPSSYEGASTGIAAGGTALARGGTSIGAGGIGGITSGVTSGVSSIGGTLSSVGSGIMNTITPLIPLATKVVLAVIVIKVALALFKKR